MIDQKIVIFSAFVKYYFSYIKIVIYKIRFVFQFFMLRIDIEYNHI